jgi:hypothetical protein
MAQLIPLATLIVLSLFEFFGLMLWLQLSITGNHLPGILILIAGLFLERFTVYITMIRPIAQDGRWSLYAQRFMLQAVRETVIWIVWLLIAQNGGIFYFVALAFLFVAMHLEHCVDVAEHNGVEKLAYWKHPKMLLLTTIEVIGATLWLYLVLEQGGNFAVGVLIVTFLWEHIYQGQMVEIKPAVKAA